MIDPMILRHTDKMQDKIERMAALLAETLPKLTIRDHYDRVEYCRICGFIVGHKQGCLVKRIEKELGQGKDQKGERT